MNPTAEAANTAMPPPPVLLGGFAESVITDPSLYDAVEVAPVLAWENPDDPTDTLCEVCDADEASFWSAYVHCRAGGVECIGDFADEQAAVDYANTIAKQHGFQPLN